MSLITVSRLSKSYGPKDIFSGISFTIPKGARTAIVGPNGIGKTTLLRILAGEEAPSEGVVSQARGITVGYLPQEASFESSHTLWEECLLPFERLREMEAELSRLEHDMSDPRQAETALQRYGSLQAEFDRQGGYTYPTRIRQVLTGLGFNPDEHNLPLDYLSGGQRTRALLARLLLSEPDLLVLDEPTNHLDIQAVEWLEGFFSQWEGATLIVSHDRYFLDRVARTILEMSRTGFEVYRGNYSAYTVQRQERWDLRHQMWESSMEKLEKELAYIKRNISGQSVLQAKGRLRRFSRIIEAVESLGYEALDGRSWGEISQDADISSHPMNLESAEKRLHSLREPSERPPHLHLNLKAAQRSGNIILRTRSIKIGYPGKELFTADDIELRRLETAALIGPNGAGKTTFLKTILGQIPALEGEVELGASLDIGYFAQAHEGLNPNRTLMEEIESIAPHMLPGEIREYLAKFLFTGEDVYKKVEVISGGERGRLALAKLAMSNANLLLLDEPTNHLDIPSQEVLQEVLADYPGTILLVSHDRYLIDALATQIWEIDEPNNKLRVFLGTYSQYRQVQEAEQEAAKAASQAEQTIQKPAQRAVKNRITAEERRRKQRLEQLEDTIHQHEQNLKLLAAQLENPPADPARVQKLGTEYVRAQEKLEELMREWEELVEV